MNTACTPPQFITFQLGAQRNRRWAKQQTRSIPANAPRFMTHDPASHRSRNGRTDKGRIVARKNAPHTDIFHYDALFTGAQLSPPQKLTGRPLSDQFPAGRPLYGNRTVLHFFCTKTAQ